MKRIVLIALVFTLIGSSTVNGQAAKSMFFELGGPGLASINFDTRFSGREDGLGGRIGVGGFSINEFGVVLIPVGLNYLLGSDRKNYFEIGAGVTPVIASDKSVDDDKENFTSTFGYLNFGYRLQPPKSGFTFRAFITPVFGSWGFFPYWGGVSFGYKF